MPDFSAASKEVFQSISFQFRDFTGQSVTSSMRVSETATALQISALRTALGNASNARVMAERATAVNQIVNIADPLNTVFDEAYSTIGDGMVFLFQNAAGTVRRLRLPAPDLSLFLADGETPDPDNTEVQAVVTAALAALPVGYIHARTYLEGVGRRQRVPLTVIEPGETDNPPALPGE